MPDPVTLEFLLDEEVTPDLFVQKVAIACSSGALRPGEGVRTPGSERIWTISDEPSPSPFVELREKPRIVLMENAVFDGSVLELHGTEDLPPGVYRIVAEAK